jgi:hypothetical protein
MSFPLQVFVSSACHELRDLRASIRTWLEELGMTPLMSDDGGFPHADRMPPYASCLRTMEQCPLVIGVIDRYYGTTFDDWGPYPEYKGLAPTHAELRHALKLCKRVLIYVQNDTWNFYEFTRKNPAALSGPLPHGLQDGTLRMFQELKQMSPAPWMEHFSDVSDVLQSLNREFVNQLYTQFHESEKQATDLTAYFIGKISDVAPEVRDRIAEGLNPALVAERDDIKLKLRQLENALETTRGEGQEKVEQLQKEKADVQSRFESVNQQLQRTGFLLAQAAIKDASWLDMVRRTMMPKQPGRVPFHHSAEVALRGYKARVNRTVPVLQEVTWSALPEREANLFRGYRAGIIFRGSDFLPGVTYARRRRGETGPPSGNTDYFWHLPNTYYGDYLEVSTSDNAPESALDCRGYEFQVKNPEGEKSEWVLFSYPFDDPALETIRANASQEAEKLFANGQPRASVEPFRKAMVFADRMYGSDDPRTVATKARWIEASRVAHLSQLRFRKGDHLRVHDGPHAGKNGIVNEILINHHFAYLIQPSTGEAFQASDSQVELQGETAST